MHSCTFKFCHPKPRAPSTEHSRSLEGHGPSRDHLFLGGVVFWTVSTADALCLLLLAPRQGHRSGYLPVGQIWFEALWERNGGDAVPGTGTFGGLLLPQGCSGGPASSHRPSPELLEMAFNCGLGTSRARWRLGGGISKGTARARGCPVPGAGAGPFARMTLGGTRSAGIPLSGMGKGGCKAALDPSSPLHHPPLYIIRLHVLQESEC